MERVYQTILGKHTVDETFETRVGDRTGLVPTPATGPLPFRYLVHKAMRTYLREITLTDPLVLPSTFLSRIFLSPSEDRLAVCVEAARVDEWGHPLRLTTFVYDFNIEQWLGNALSLQRHNIEQVHFLDDGRVVTGSNYDIVVWTQTNGNWIPQVHFGPFRALICHYGNVYQQREFVFQWGGRRIVAMDLSNGSVRDMARVPDSVWPSIALLSDRWLLFNSDRWLLFNRLALSSHVFDLERSEFSQLLAGRILPIQFSQSKFVHVTTDGAACAMEIGEDGRCTEVESFAMRIPRFSRVVEVSGSYYLIVETPGVRGVRLCDLRTGELLRRLNCTSTSFVVSATRNEILINTYKYNRPGQDQGVVRIRAYCLEQPPL